jgi:type I restriction enzyme S subunit
MIVELTPADVLRSEWPTLPLSEGLLSGVQPGFACGNHNRNGDGIVHVRPFNVNTDGNMDFSSVKFIPKTEAHRPERLLQRDDVVFNNTNSPELVGKTAIYQEQDSRAFSNHMTRLRVNPDRLRPAFLAMALHQLWREGYFADKCNNHVSQASISRSVLLETEIPVPPLAEQDSLVEQVRTAQDKVEGVRDRLATIPTLLKKFRQSVLAAACSGQLTADWRKMIGREVDYGSFESHGEIELPDLPAVWSYTPMKDWLESLKYGTSAKCLPNVDGTPVLRIPNVSGGSLDLRDMKFARLPIKEASELSLRSGDSLMIRSNGSVTLVGRTVSVSSAAVNMAYAGYLLRLRPKNVDSSVFLRMALESDLLRLQIELPARSTSGVHNINTKEVFGLLIPTPPLDEQTEIVRRVESLFALADSIESRLADATAQVERTTQAILAKAFRGELTH